MVKKEGIMWIDAEFLESLGLDEMSKEEKEEFIRQAEEEFEVRVGRMIAEEVGSAKVAEFDAIEDDDEAAVWLNENLPAYRDDVRGVYEAFRAELAAARAEIMD